MHGSFAGGTWPTPTRRKDEGALIVSVVLNVCLVLVCLWLWGAYQRSRRLRNALKNEFSPNVIPVQALDQFHSAFQSHPLLGPGQAAQVQFIGKGDLNVLGGTSDAEAWILAVLAKTANTFFEFGTCTGKTTYLWACNSSAKAKIYTLTLRESQEGYQAESGDSKGAEQSARTESIAQFLYSGTLEEQKIVQLYGDSKALNEAPYLQQMDLIFIDGSHAYSYIKSDTEKALRMLAPGGIILWHDYRPYQKEVADVRRYLEELARSISLVHLQGTSLVAYRRSG